GDFNLINNVIYNWRHRTVDGGDQTSRVNLINNYFKPGPATPVGAPISYRIIRPESRAKGPDGQPLWGQYYVCGNVVEGNDRVTADNWNGGVQFGGDDRRDPASAVQSFIAAARSEKPMPMAPVTIHSAHEAYEIVLANAGATLPRRDAVDERIVSMVRSGSFTPPRVPDDIFEQLNKVGYTEERIREMIALIHKGIITDPSQVGGYPAYQGTPYADADSDGMPDDWEREHGLNPSDPGDSTGDLNGDGYTNIEKFIYGIDPKQKIDFTDLKNNRDLLRPVR
ncbi:MAG: hypothetical protein RMJ35_12085, partial [Phycisphaerales bacterium]|nr:hypothetical protein [Phycisphaerales bacterium]